MIKKLFTEHCEDTASPQTYITHGLFAGKNSLILIYGGILGVIHAIFPFWFEFSTSTIVIKSFNKLVASGRHNDELIRENLEQHVK